MKRENKKHQPLKVFPVDVQEIKVYKAINEAIHSKTSITQMGEKEKIFSTSNVAGRLVGKFV